MSPSERYFRPKAIELDGRLYEWLGVLRFKRLLLGLVRPDPARPGESPYFLGGRGPADLRRFEKRTRRNELMHLPGLVLGLLLLGMVAARWNLGMCLAGALLVGGNFHCFILQRYNRIRIDRLLRRTRDAAEARG